FELEVLETVAVLRCFGEADDRRGRERFLVAQTKPTVRAARAAIGQARPCAVAEVEQITKHLHRGALLAFAQERSDRHIEKLPEQVEHCRLDRGQRMDHYAQIEGLLAAPAAIPLSKAIA